jgi:hypothetical protein
MQNYEVNHSIQLKFPGKLSKWREPRNIRSNKELVVYAAENPHSPHSNPRIPHKPQVKTEEYDRLNRIFGNNSYAVVAWLNLSTGLIYSRG